MSEPMLTIHNRWLPDRGEAAQLPPRRRPGSSVRQRAAPLRREIFDRAEIQTYLDTVHRVGPLGHVASDEVYEEMSDVGAIDENPVWWAREILLIERAKKLLLA